MSNPAKGQILYSHTGQTSGLPVWVKKWG